MLATVHSLGIFLHVRSSNKKAITFYKLHRFYPYHFITSYYHTRIEENDSQDAWIMVRDLRSRSSCPTCVRLTPTNTGE